MSRSLLACILVLFGLASQAQELTYDVIRNGSRMGTTVVGRTVDGGLVSYALNTKTSFRVLLSFDVVYDLQETFDHDILVEGTSYSTLNGSMQKETSIKKQEGGYQLVIDHVPTRINDLSIRQSVSQVYFQEPTDGQEVFSAYFARYLPFRKLGDHMYLLVSPDGKNTYHYENGVCVRVDIVRDFASFSQVLRPVHLKEIRSGQDLKVLNNKK